MQVARTPTTRRARASVSQPCPDGVGTPAVVVVRGPRGLEVDLGEARGGEDGGAREQDRVELASPEFEVRAG